MSSTPTSVYKLHSHLKKSMGSINLNEENNNNNNEYDDDYDNVGSSIKLATSGGTTSSSATTTKTASSSCALDELKASLTHCELVDDLLDVDYSDDVEQQDEDEFVKFSTYINRNLSEKQIRELFYVDYSVGSEIGKGGFGTIFNGVRKADAKLVAIKVIKKTKVTQWYEFNSVDSSSNDLDGIYEMEYDNNNTSNVDSNNNNNNNNSSNDGSNARRKHANNIVAHTTTRTTMIKCDDNNNNNKYSNGSKMTTTTTTTDNGVVDNQDILITKKIPLEIALMIKVNLFFAIVTFVNFK
jgi:hypothetical protein